MEALGDNMEMVWSLEIVVETVQKFVWKLELRWEK